MKFMKKSISLILIFFLVACSYKPILDQNAKYISVGQEQADVDIEECTKMADDYLDKYKAERALKEAGRKSIIGAFFGAITGFILGGSGESALIGTAIGAGSGAVVGGASVAGEGKVTPDQIKQHYISNCLAREGYQVIGWM